MHGAEEPGRLLLVAHHLIVDGFSWRVLLEDLDLAYRQHAAGEANDLGTPTCSFRRWAEAMGLKVDRLARLSYGPVRLGDLPPGRYRPLTPKEEAQLYKAIRMEVEEG